MDLTKIMTFPIDSKSQKIIGVSSARVALLSLAIFLVFSTCANSAESDVIEEQPYPTLSPLSFTLDVASCEKLVEKKVYLEGFLAWETENQRLYAYKDDALIFRTVHAVWLNGLPDGIDVGQYRNQYVRIVGKVVKRVEGGIVYWTLNVIKITLFKSQ